VCEYTGVRAVGEDALEEDVRRVVVRRHVPLLAVEDVLVSVAASGGLEL
jgi:hypothetical protein